MTERSHPWSRRSILMVTGIVGALGLFGCDPCKQVHTVQSPDGKFLAEETKDYCNSASAEVRISVRPADGTKPTPADDNVFIVSHGHSVDLEWIDVRTLRISCRDCAARDIAFKREQIGAVTIRLEVSDEFAKP